MCSSPAPDNKNQKNIKFGKNANIGKTVIEILFRTIQLTSCLIGVGKKFYLKELKLDQKYVCSVVTPNKGRIPANSKTQPSDLMPTSFSIIPIKKAGKVETIFLGEDEHGGI